MQWPVALAASALFALVIGALQSAHARRLFHHDHVGLRADGLLRRRQASARYGGDDGLTIYKRSQFAGLSISPTRAQFYYICLVLLFGAIYLVVADREFAVRPGDPGRALERVRMRAIGFPTYRYKLVCFVIAGTMCGLAGALLANHTDFVSPAIDVLDALRRPHHHGGARRHGHRCSARCSARWRCWCSRKCCRRSLASPASCSFQQCDGDAGILADHPRSAAVAGRAVRARRHRRPAEEASRRD